MTVKKKKKPSPKVKLVWVKKHKLKTVLVAMLLIFIGGLVYNKFLDYRNVQDMEQLLADFQRLEKDVEAETGEELYIEADCGSVGKFATSYSCAVSLVGSSLASSTYIQQIYEYVSLHDRCEILNNGKNDYLNAVYCNAHVRNPNKDKANSLFSKYKASSEFSPN